MGRQRVSQRRVAEILGISQPQVSARLRGKVAFNTEELGLLAAAWNVPAARFLLDASAAV
jgi:predicted transcriptional regulator